MTTAPPSPEPLLDLQRLMVAIRRRRRAWLAAGLAGLALGVALAIVAPAAPTAVTRILIVHEDDEGAAAGALIKTDIALLETTRVAAAALRSIGAADRPEDFLKDYEATALTSNVLELKVTGSSDADAVARAGAVAEAFIADHVKRVEDGAQADSQALLERRKSAQDQLAQVDAAIAAMSPADRSANPTQLDALLNQRNDLTSQISDLTSRAQASGFGAPRVAAGTQVVDAPRALPRSFLRSAVLNGGVGFMLLLVAGLGLAAVAGVVRDRPVLRREISAQLGASVIAQLREPPRGPSRLWLDGRRTAGRRRVAATLARAVRGEGGSVSLLELGAPRAAAALALDMAEALSADAPVLLVDDLPRGRLATMLGEAQRPIRVVDGAELVNAEPRAKERQIGVGSVRPGTAWTDLGRLGAETLLVVRAGHANTLWLHTVARQLADLQIPVIGVVLVDPDRKDGSDGTLWDGLHTAIRGRASATARALATATVAAPPGRSSNGATYSDDYPTETLAPIWPTSEDVEGPVNVPSRRHRRSDG